MLNKISEIPVLYCRAMRHAAGPVGIEEETRRRVARRLMPFIFLLYIVSYLDRVNVGFAALQMRRELGLSGTVFASTTSDR